MADKKTLAFMLTADKGDDRNGYWHAKARLIELVDGSTPRNLGSYREDDGIADLEITAQNTTDVAARGEGSYGWTVQFKDVYSADLHKATAMASTLKRIANRMAKLADKYGSPQAFGIYVLHAADALGVKSYVVESERPTNGMYSTGVYRVLSGPEAVAWLARAEGQYIASVSNVPVAV